MVKLLLLLVVFCFSGFLLSNTYGQGTLSVGEKISEFEFIDLNGDIIQDTDLFGQVVVIDFWASWCAPCIKSIPALIALEEKYKDNEQVRFLFVNTLEFQGRGNDYISDFLKKKGFEIQVYFDNGSLTTKSFSDVMNITSLPLRLILDNTGTIKYIDSGYSGTEEDMKEDLEKKITGLLN